MCVQSQQLRERVSAIVLFAYGDESLDETQQRVCAVAAVIGTEEEWNRFEPLWIARNGGLPFHAKDCENDQGDYTNRHHAENLALYRDLTVMLAESELSGYAAASDLIAERRYYPDLSMRYLREFSMVIDAMAWFSKEHSEMAELCFDNRAETDYNAALMYADARSTIPAGDVRLASKISFESSRKNPRIQVADLFAREAMKLSNNAIGEVQRAPRKSWLALEATGRFKVDLTLDPFFSAEKEFWKTAASLGGARYAEYRSWLQKTRRQHNLSNVIDFISKHPRSE